MNAFTPRAGLRQRNGTFEAGRSRTEVPQSVPTAAHPTVEIRPKIDGQIRLSRVLECRGKHFEHRRVLCARDSELRLIQSRPRIQNGI